MLINRVVSSLAVLCATVCCLPPVAAQTPPGAAVPAALQPRATLANPMPNTFGFGTSVAIDGDTLAVGAPYIAQNGIQRGGVAIYVRSGSTWALQQTLTRTDGIAFGGEVALSGNTLVVGRRDYSQGGIGTYVYVRNNGTWTFQAVLTSSGSPTRNAMDIAVDGDTALVSYNSGGVYVFVRTGAVWAEQARLRPEDPAGQQTTERSTSTATRRSSAFHSRP